MAKGIYRSKLSLLVASTLGVGIAFVPTTSAFAQSALPPVQCAGGTITNAGAGECALIDGENTWWGTYTGFSGLPIQQGVLWCGDGFNNGKFFPNSSYNYAPAAPPNTVNQTYLNGVGYALSYLATYGINSGGTNYNETTNDGAVAGRLLIWDLLYGIAPSGETATQLDIYNQLLAIATSTNANNYTNPPAASTNSSLVLSTQGAQANQLTVNQPYTAQFAVTDGKGVPYDNIPVTFNITGGYFNTAGNPTSITVVTNAQGQIPVIGFTPTSTNAGAISLVNGAVPSNGLQWYTPTTGVNAQDGVGAGGAFPINAVLSFKALAPQGRIQIQKTGNDPSRSVQGAVFTIHDNTNPNTPDQQLTIGANGLSQLSSFYPAGDSLTVTETTTPTDYQAAPSQNVTVQGNINLTLNFADQVIPATVTVDKTGNDPSRSVQGAVFTVTDGNNHQDGTLTVGANGTTNTLSLQPDVAYTVTETTTPTGYQAAPPQNFTPTPGQSVTLNFADQIQEATLQIKKLGNDQGVLSVAGAVFQVEDSQGTVLDTLTIGSNGMSEISSPLPPDQKLTLHEKTPPTGYQTAPDQVVTLTPGQQDVVFTFSDQAILGQLTVKKVSSATGQLLQGAKFNITDAQGNLVTQIVTGSNGIATASNLLPGKYVVTEVGAPTGYNLSSSINASVTPGNNVLVMDSDSPLAPSNGGGTTTVPSSNGGGSTAVAPSSTTVSVPSANTGALWANPVTYFGGASVTGVSGGLLALFGRRKRKNRGEDNGNGNN